MTFIDKVQSSNYCKRRVAASHLFIYSNCVQGANPNLPADTVYDKSKYLDYPSIGQLRAAFKDNKIQPIFAVTKEVRSLYEVKALHL